MTLKVLKSRKTISQKHFGFLVSVAVLYQKHLHDWKVRSEFYQLWQPLKFSERTVASIKLYSHRMRQRHVFCILMSKKFRTLLYLWELSHQRRNNIIGLAARYKIFGVKAHKEIIGFLFCPFKYKKRCCPIRWKLSLTSVSP